MKSSVCLQGLVAMCIAVTASAASAQNAIQLFGPADVRNSTQGTGHGDQANIFNTKILNLSCPSSIQATISSSPEGTGYVLVDNYISLSVGEAGPVDICSQGVTDPGAPPNCFSSSYQTKASSGTLNGTNPDTLLPGGGVPPIDISSYLWPGAIQAQIGLVDTGFYLTGSALYLVTNCTPNGVSGPGQVTGNPISETNPTSQQLTQAYPFNSYTNQQVQFTYDLSQAHDANTLSITDGSTPSTGDTTIDPGVFPSYLSGTSFATANCLLHSGELNNGAPACKLYTLTCQIGSNNDQKGVLCPKSSESNEIFQEDFDGPSFTLPDVAGTGGPFHQGVAFLEATDAWGGGSCVFDSSSSLANSICPQNVLTNFSGPGRYTSGGSGQDPNSTFITIAPVPEDLTTITVTGQQPGYWVNSQSPTVTFVSTPPAIASTNNFIASPIKSLTYGISMASNVPPSGSPVHGDTTLNDGTCTMPGQNPPPAFQPPVQSVSVPADGQYLLHYFAQDCAGTRELKFTQTGGSWSTSFYTFPINVDTVAPLIPSGPSLTPAPSTNGGVPNSYLMGQTVTATYRCTDGLSGIVKCGTSTYAPGATNDTGSITSPVDTTMAGPRTFTVNAIDAAGNTATASVNYLVVAAPPANLSILKLAPPRVKQNAQLIYGITAVNLGKQPASAISITDPLPVGVTFVKASAQQIICGNKKCSNAASCTFANNTVSCTAPSLTFATPVLVEIVVSVQASAGTTIKNTATVGSANPEGKGTTQSTAVTKVQ